ncbi:polymerase II transcription elongation factor [Mycena kentingensis (nom. inval.)]|nr:polymerase II transcription elongation factor [Mycena kentingensis (nom. inval.)]
MGTRGYKVYRHKGFYYIYYNHYDSYPSGLGVNFKAQIPKDKAEYERWLERERAEFDQVFEENKDRIDDDDSDIGISREAPQNDLFIEWIYEIDLDNEVFHVDSMPVFSLRNMPPTDRTPVYVGRGSNINWDKPGSSTDALFCDYIGFDSYGHRSCTHSTPAEHRYTANGAAAPAPVDAKTIAAYRAHKPEIATVTSNELLDVVSNPAASWEAARIALYEVFVGGKMRNYESLAQCIYRESIPSRLYAWGEQVLRFGLGRMWIGTDAMALGESSNVETAPFEWIVPNVVCFRWATQLNDEANLKKHVLELVTAIADIKPAGNEPIFAILFSIFHCAIVSIEPNSIKVTAAMQFIPSFHTRSPSTPGIAAIARLGSHISRMRINPNLKPDNSKTTGLHLPTELIEPIAAHLPPKDLIALSFASPALVPGLDIAMRFPYAGDFRLERVVPRQIPSGAAAASDNESPSPLEDTHCAEFGVAYLGEDPVCKEASVVEVIMRAEKLALVSGKKQTMVYYDDRELE